MARKKQKRVCCFIFPKSGFKWKYDVLDWCIKNDKEFDLNIDKQNKIQKSDKEYIIRLRPLSKFKEVNKQNKNGVKIMKGFLK